MQSQRKRERLTSLSTPEVAMLKDTPPWKFITCFDWARPRVISIENDVPERPCTVFVNPRARVPATVFFKALNNASADPCLLSCIQLQSNGKIIELTSCSSGLHERFLSLNTIEIHVKPFALLHVGPSPNFATHLMKCPILQLLLIYSSILMSSTTIVVTLNTLALNILRMVFIITASVLKQLIPNFMHFGRIQINLCYNNKTQTCRHCHCTEHFANTCPQTYILQLQRNC